MTTLIRTFGGNIGIGTNDPGIYKLRVDGSVRATSLEVGGVTNAHIPSGAIGIWYGNSTDIPTGWVICDGTNGTPDLSDKIIRCASGDAAPSPTVVNTEGGSDNTTLTADSMLTSHSHTITVHAANSPHKHNVSNQQAGHTHGNSNQVDQHYHNASGINWRQNQYFINSNVGGSGNQLATHAVQGQNDSAISHAGGHNHNLPTHNLQHSHGGSSTRSVHSHTATAEQTGSGDAIPVTNPYYALYYIMKL
jgi:hypothetical protein